MIGWAVNRSKMPRDPFAAWMHSLILWGFIILFIGTTMVFLEHQTPLHFYYGTFYLIASAVLDLGGVAFLVGLGMAVIEDTCIEKPDSRRLAGWMPCWCC